MHLKTIFIKIFQSPKNTVKYALKDSLREDTLREDVLALLKVEYIFCESV